MFKVVLKEGKGSYSSFKSSSIGIYHIRYHLFPYVYYPLLPCLQAVPHWSQKPSLSVRHKTLQYSFRSGHSITMIYSKNVNWGNWTSKRVARYLLSLDFLSIIRTWLLTSQDHHIPLSGLQMSTLFLTPTLILMPSPPYPSWLLVRLLYPKVSKNPHSVREDIFSKFDHQTFFWQIRKVTRQTKRWFLIS